MRLVSLNTDFQEDQLLILEKDNELNRVVDKLYTQGSWNAKRVFMMRNESAKCGKTHGMAYIDEENQVVGWFGFIAYAGDDADWETTVYLASHLWNRGHAKIAYSWIDENAYRFPNTVVCIHEDNFASQKARFKHGDDFILTPEPFRSRNSYRKFIS